MRLEKPVGLLEKVRTSVLTGFVLQKLGPSLPRPHADLIHFSRHANMKELRIQHSGRPYRVLFAFDPRRCAILHLEALKKGQEKK